MMPHLAVAASSPPQIRDFHPSPFGREFELRTRRVGDEDDECGKAILHPATDHSKSLEAIATTWLQYQGDMTSG
jgi:hypothetical protein